MGRWAWLLVLCAGCVDADAGSTGRLVVRANGGNEARDGIARERFADGYAVQYEHALLSVSALAVAELDGERAQLDFTPVVVDLVPSAVTVAELHGLDARRWDDVGFRSAPPGEGVRNQNAPPELVARMVSRRYSFLQTGTLTAPDGARIPFELGLPVAIDYFRCSAGDGTLGFVVPANGTAEVELTWHLTHAWFDSFAEDSAYRAEAVAAVYDGVNPVTLEQLAQQPLAQLRGRDGQRLVDGSGNPVVYIPPQEPGVRTLRDFLAHTRFGHFNGLAGACQSELTLL
jgi:hypothetical protein